MFLITIADNHCSGGRITLLHNIEFLQTNYFPCHHPWNPHVSADFFLATVQPRPSYHGVVNVVSHKSVILGVQAGADGRPGGEADRGKDGLHVLGRDPGLDEPVEAREVLGVESVQVIPPDCTELGTFGIF